MRVGSKNPWAEYSSPLFTPAPFGYVETPRGFTPWFDFLNIGTVDAVNSYRKQCHEKLLQKNQ